MIEKIIDKVQSDISLKMDTEIEKIIKRYGYNSLEEMKEKGVYELLIQEDSYLQKGKGGISDTYVVEAKIKVVEVKDIINLKMIVPIAM